MPNPRGINQYSKGGGGGRSKAGAKGGKSAKANVSKVPGKKGQTTEATWRRIAAQQKAAKTFLAKTKASSRVSPAARAAAQTALMSKNNARGAARQAAAAKKLQNFAHKKYGR